MFLLWTELGVVDRLGSVRVCDCVRCEGVGQLSVPDCRW